MKKSAAILSLVLFLIAALLILFRCFLFSHDAYYIVSIDERKPAYIEDGVFTFWAQGVYLSSFSSEIGDTFPSIKKLRSQSKEYKVKVKKEPEFDSKILEYVKSNIREYDSPSYFKKLMNDVKVAHCRENECTIRFSSINNNMVFGVRSCFAVSILLKCTHYGQTHPNRIPRCGVPHHLTRKCSTSNL